MAMAAILLEISYTRVFSFKLFYYFTYLTIGIVLLGMGSGGPAPTGVPSHFNKPPIFSWSKPVASSTESRSPH